METKDRATQLLEQMRSAHPALDDHTFNMSISVTTQMMHRAAQLESTSPEPESLGLDSEADLPAIVDTAIASLVGMVLAYAAYREIDIDDLLDKASASFMSLQTGEMLDPEDVNIETETEETGAPEGVTLQ